MKVLEALSTYAMTVSTRMAISYGPLLASPSRVRARVSGRDESLPPSQYPRTSGAVESPLAERSLATVPLPTPGRGGVRLAPLIRTRVALALGENYHLLFATGAPTPGADRCPFVKRAITSNRRGRRWSMSFTSLHCVALGERSSRVISLRLDGGGIG